MKGLSYAKHRSEQIKRRKASREMKDIQYKIVKEIIVLSASGSGYTKEINLISWNGKRPKYDIRNFPLIVKSAEKALLSRKRKRLILSDWQGGDVSLTFLERKIRVWESIRKRIKRESVLWKNS